VHLLVEFDYLLLEQLARLAQLAQLCVEQLLQNGRANWIGLDDCLRFLIDLSVEHIG
jgi:hypothetical protein